MTIRNKKQLYAALFAAMLNQVLPAQPGTLDGFFGDGGKLMVPVGPGDDLAHAAALQTDDKIVVAGWSHDGVSFDFALTRFTAEGNLDHSFDADGKLSTAFGTESDYATSVAIQPDGKIVAAGWSFNGADLDFALARYHADGSLDAGFGMGGKQTTDLGASDYIAAVAVQPDGKIVVAGHTTAASGTLDFALARYHPDGTLDTAFGTGGVQATDFQQQSDLGASVVLQPDGKIIVAGLAVTGADYDFALARYNADGSLDQNFGTGGKCTTAIGPSDDKGISVVLQSDGKIIVGGYLYNGTGYDFALTRYHVNGTLDHDFGTAGIVVTDFFGKDDLIASVTLQPDGKILAAGRSSDGSHYNFALARYTANGQLDDGFGTSGKVVTPVSAGLNSAFSVLVQPGGKIVLAGYAHNGTDYDFALARYYSGLSVGVHDAPGSVIAASVYPNPASEFTMLEYALNHPEVVSIRLLDLNGRVVHTILEQEFKTAGAHQQPVALPASLPTGLYSVSIATGSGEMAIRLVKQGSH